MDLMGPLKMTKDDNVYVAVAVDAFSKFVEAKGNLKQARNYDAYPTEIS